MIHAIECTFGRSRETPWEKLGIVFGLKQRSVSVVTIAFGGLICHRWPGMLLNERCTLFSNPLSPP